MSLDRRTTALLDVIAEYRRSRCDALLTPARAQARALVAAALREARRRVQTALADERQRAAAQVAAAQAQLATERRLAGQRHAAAQLQQGWDALRTALQARWDDAARRRAWTDAHLTRALRVLAPAAAAATDDVALRWQLAVPTDWPAAEVDAACARLRDGGVPAVEVVVEPMLRAGFRVQAGHNVLDATLDGLLADRAAVQGRLLTLLEDAR